MFSRSAGTSLWLVWSGFLAWCQQHTERHVHLILSLQNLPGIKKSLAFNKRNPNSVKLMIFFPAAQADGPQCLHRSAQKERCCQAAAETPGSGKSSLCLLQGEQTGKCSLCLFFTLDPRGLKLIFNLLQKVYLREISELSNYIDRSQLTVSLGGYLMYCHHSWVSFIKVIHIFVEKMPKSVTSTSLFSNILSLFYRLAVMSMKI